METKISRAREKAGHFTMTGVVNISGFALFNLIYRRSATPCGSYDTAYNRYGELASPSCMALTSMASWLQPNMKAANPPMPHAIMQALRQFPKVGFYLAAAHGTSMRAVPANSFATTPLVCTMHGLRHSGQSLPVLATSFYRWLNVVCHT